MTFGALFPTSSDDESHGAFRLVVWTVVVATIVTLGLYCLRSSLVRPSKRNKFHRRRTLRKSVQMRPKRRRAKRIDSNFSAGFRHDKPQEISAQLLAEIDKEESSVTSQETEYEEYEDYDLDEASLKVMRDELPDSTMAECRRFLIDKDGETREAIEALQSYLEWRQKYADIEAKLEAEREEEPQEDNLKLGAGGDSDLVLWNKAVAIALHANDEPSGQALPRVVRTFQSAGEEYTDDGGHVIIKLTPGQIDRNLVNDVKSYSLAIAIYLDRKMDRNDAHDTVTLLIDVRGGKGWPNPTPKTLMPFLKHTIHLLLDMMPERLHHAIVFPIPGAFRWIWSVVQRGMDPETVDRCRLVSGAARISSEPPTGELSEYMSRDLVEFMEDERLATFVC